MRVDIILKFVLKLILIHALDIRFQYTLKMILFVFRLLLFDGCHRENTLGLYGMFNEAKGTQ